jgi:glucan-binding YG repeat protein
LRKLDEAKSLFELHADNVRVLKQKITKLTDEQGELTLKRRQLVEKQEKLESEQRRLVTELRDFESSLSKLKTELEFKSREERAQEIKLGLAANSVKEYQRKINEEIEDQRREARLGNAANDNKKSSEYRRAA